MQPPSLATETCCCWTRQGPSEREGPCPRARGFSRRRRLPALLCLPQVDGLDEPGAWVSWVLGGQGSCQVQSRDPDSGSGVKWPQLHRRARRRSPGATPFPDLHLPLPRGDCELGPGAGRQAPRPRGRSGEPAPPRRPPAVLSLCCRAAGPRRAQSRQTPCVRPPAVVAPFLGAWVRFCPRSQCARRPCHTRRREGSGHGGTPPPQTRLPLGRQRTTPAPPPPPRPAWPELPGFLSPHPVLSLPPPPARPAQFTDGRYWIYSPRHRRLRAVTLSSSGTVSDRSRPPGSPAPAPPPGTGGCLRAWPSVFL